MNIKTLDLKDYPNRVLGVLLMLKICLPPLIVALLIGGLVSLTQGVGGAITTGLGKITPQLENAKLQIQAIREEGKRLAGEIKQIKNETTELAQDIKKSVEPIRKSLLGLSSVMQAISKTLETILNTIIRIVNKIPGIKDMGLVHMPNIKVPGITLPNIKIDVNLYPNMAAVEQLQNISQHIADEAEIIIEQLENAVTFWWWTVKIVVFLLVTWTILGLVGYGARSKHRFMSGLQLARGQPVAGAVQML